MDNESEPAGLRPSPGAILDCFFASAYPSL